MGWFFKILSFTALLSFANADFTYAGDFSDFCHRVTTRVGELLGYPALEPSRTYETPRLIIRPFANSMLDIWPYLQLLKNSNSRYFHPFGKFEVDFHTFRKDHDAQQTGRGYRLAIVERESARIVGFLSFHHWHRLRREVEVGFVLDESVWGRGYFAESFEATKEHLKSLGISSVVARVHPDNARSISSLKRLGFEAVGKVEEMALDGSPLELLVFKVSL